MPLPRLITLIVGIIVILGLILWLVDSLQRLYGQIAWSNPFLGTIFILLVVVLLGILIAAFIYYFRLYSESGSQTKGKQKRPRIQIPERKSQAAEQNLKAVRQQLGQIQDKVAKKVLLSKSKEIAQNLARGEFKVIIFGMGSAGKTSIVNALIGEIVGEVAPTMGTTTIGETYRLKLQGLEREISISDTPGILEAGVAGTERETLARQLAVDADLLLFIVDNDLRHSEYEPLKNLVAIGKRSLLIFNKIDLYAEEDKEVILRQLRERVRDFLAPADVLAVAANPQSVRLETGEIIAPDAEIMPLVKRLVAVLRAEGEDLIADNILLQSHRLGEEARKLLERQRKRQAEKIIDRYQWIGAGVIVITPLPVVDMLATAAVNAQMVVEIGRVYGCELNIDRGKELALSLGKTLVSLGVVKGAIDLLARVLQLNVATYVVGKVIQGVTAAYLTRIAGKSFIEYFRQDLDWGDGGIAEVVQKQFQLSRKEEFLKAFVKDAIAKVIQPLSGNLEDVTDEDDLEELKIDDRELEAVILERDRDDRKPRKFVPDRSGRIIEDDWESERIDDDW
jgi:GTPase SAR1 family protein